MKCINVWINVETWYHMITNECGYVFATEWRHKEQCVHWEVNECQPKSSVAEALMQDL